MRKLVLILIAVASPILAQALNPEFRISYVPEVDKIQVVSVGTVMHEYSRTYSFNATVVETPMKGGGDWLLPSVIEPGTPMYAEQSKYKFKACTTDRLCGYDEDSDGTFDCMNEGDKLWAKKLKTLVKYSQKRLTVDRSDSLRQVIIYAGSTGDTLRLSYREFKNDLARPAFTEELTIPMTKKFPQDVAVKAVKFRIHSIDGLGMKYEILP